jgi:hypothetical protein
MKLAFFIIEVRNFIIRADQAKGGIGWPLIQQQAIKTSG